MPADLPDQMPPWAIARANGMLMIGAQLPTRDGRAIGNAFITEVHHDAALGTLYSILTDAGGTARFTGTEIAGLFHPPQWVVDIDKAKQRVLRASDAARAAPPSPAIQPFDGPTRERARHLVAVLMDGFHHLQTVACRGVEATEGTPAILAFDAVRKELAAFERNAPALQALRAAVLRMPERPKPKEARHD